MTIKNKLKLTKAILTVTLLVFGALISIDSFNKREIISELGEIRFSLNQSLATAEKEDDVLYYEYCKSLKEFVDKHPIEIDFVLPCDKMNNLEDTSIVNHYLSDFFDQVHLIESEYQRLNHTASNRMALTLIFVNILLLLGVIIDRIKSDNENSSE
ncbi:hypothetical protein [Carboxylicivirga taeanensis]|uniref:hypothetical protein n=1 Tax=Carboxylicivirga taeanensis TaxID=1416875 RepID=UPI003F6DC160